MWTINIIDHAHFDHHAVVPIHHIKDTNFPSAKARRQIPAKNHVHLNQQAHLSHFGTAVIGLGGPSERSNVHFISVAAGHSI